VNEGQSQNECIGLFQAVYIHKKTDGALRNAWGKIMRKRGVKEECQQRMRKYSEELSLGNIYNICTYVPTSPHGESPTDKLISNHNEKERRRGIAST
jgi:hypothetical protein